MRAIPFALLLISGSGAIFAIPQMTELPPRPIAAAALGILGGAILVATLCQRASGRLNQPPAPPYFRFDKVHGGALELACNGNYESCQSLLNDLSCVFGATYSRHLDPGPSNNDKQKGYWNVTMFDQEFFLMREGGAGICIWGAKPPADPSGFLQLASQYNAVEFVTWQQRLLRRLKVAPNPTVHTAT